MGAFKIGQNIWLWLLGGGSGTNESQLNENLGSIMSQYDMEKTVGISGSMLLYTQIRGRDTLSIQF